MFIFKEQKKYKYAAIGNNDDYVRRIYNNGLNYENTCSADKLLKTSKAKEYILKQSDSIVDLYKENK